MSAHLARVKNAPVSAWHASASGCVWERIDSRMTRPPGGQKKMYEGTIVRVIITQIRTTSIPGNFRFFGHPILVILWAITLRRLGRHRQTVRWVAQSEMAETKEF